MRRSMILLAPVILTTSFAWANVSPPAAGVTPAPPRADAPSHSGARSHTDAPSQADPSHVVTTGRFAFHSNLWLNLNHYLHRLASGDEARRPADPVEHALVASLPPESRRIWDRAVAYYAAHHAADDLRTDDTLFAFKRWAIELEPDVVLASDDFDPEWLEVLNAVAPVYRERFWPAHDARNRATVLHQLALIRTIEDPVFDRIAELAQAEWQTEPIRVDLSYYGNWAGAYTTNRPAVQVVLSSVDIQPPLDWLELLFHEPSHSIIGGWSPVGQAIDSVAADLGMEYRGQLWHALLFYFSGRAVEEALAPMGVEHEPYMLARGVFSSVHPLLLEHVEPYVRGEIGLEEAIRGVLVGLR